MFGRWTVITQGSPRKGTAYWRVVCRCGNTAEVAGTRLIRGRSTQCHACSSRNTGYANRKHGHRRNGKRTVEYIAYGSMLSRCYNHKDISYLRYGGRDITVCRKWRGPSGFQRFLADVGARPAPGYSIGRINNNLNYTPSNVEWQTVGTQANNRRGNRTIRVGHVTRTASEWSRILGMGRNEVNQRVRNGWDPVVAATTPRIRRR